MKLPTGLLFHNALYKVIALLVATVLWAAVQGTRSDEYSLDLPIVLEELPGYMVVVDQSTRDLLQQVLDEYGTGVLVQRVQMQDAAPPPQVIDAFNEVQRARQVRADVVGVPPPGHKLLGVEVTPSEILLAGARTSMRRVRDVLTESVDLSEIRQTTVQEVSLVFSGLHVWRAEEEGPPVKVEIRIQGPPGEAARQKPDRKHG